MKNKKSSGKKNPAKTDSHTENNLLSLDEALSTLKTTRSTLYRWIAQGLIHGVKAGRQWRFEKQEIERFLTGQAPSLSLNLGSSINSAVQALETLNPSKAQQEYNTAVSAPDCADPLYALAGAIIWAGIELGASDIHIEPQSQQLRLRYRIDGVMSDPVELSTKLCAPLAEKFKSMFKGNVQEKNLPQDGRIQLKMNSQPVDLRVNVLPSLYGESIVIRIMPAHRASVSLEQIITQDNQCEQLKQALGSGYGQIIFTGPVSCGKTTLAYSCLNHLNRNGVKILTVEDPVEQPIDGIIQTQIHPSSGRTFANIIRSILRQDPDILHVSEIREEITAQICANAALAGHLVLSALHAKTAAAALKRLADLSLPPFVIADSVRLIVAQRLVRRLCPYCRAERPLTENDRLRITRILEAQGQQIIELPETIPHAVGCDKCKKLGYQGRQLITEMLRITPEIASALARNATAEELQAIAIGQGMSSLASEGMRCVTQGTTTIDDVYSVIEL